MPRRGERQRVFPIVEPPPVLDRIGVRTIQAPDRQGTLQTRTFDPTRFRCATLAAELADEWVDHITGSGIRVITAATYRKGIRDFCEVVDRLFGESAAKLTLSGHGRDLGFALAQWERELPAGYPPGSMRPAALASAVRGLIALRAEHSGRPVDADLVRFVHGPLGVERGASRELDEFSRGDKTRMVRAAAVWTRELEHRLDRGWGLVAQGRHPAKHGWTRIENLVWGLAQRVVTPDDIRRNLPRCRDWPPELRACIEPPGTVVHPRTAKRLLVTWLLAQLYPGDLDLHAFRVLLVASTGHAPEEVSDLTTADVEFLPGGSG